MAMVMGMLAMQAPVLELFVAMEAQAHCAPPSVCFVPSSSADSGTAGGEGSEASTQAGSSVSAQYVARQAGRSTHRPVFAC